MQRINGTIKHYAWGTHDQIPAILGIPADGRPFAEYWLGAHPLSPSLIGDKPLDEALREEQSALGERCVEHFGDKLPFLMKILSARHPVSIQAHPPRAKAEEGFARENAAQIPVDDPVRTYRDDWPKPEIMVALTQFDSLAGFRAPQHTVRLFEELGVLDIVGSVIGPLTFREGAAGIEEVFLDVLSLAGDRLDIINHVLAASVSHVHDDSEVGEFARTAVELDEAFPGDPGIMAALLMNRVRLQPGEALYVPTGTMHAHLSGTGVEVMANSDNVIRGGLTNKHIAVDELVTVVDFADFAPTVLRGTEVQPGVFDYPTECLEFDVWRLEVEGDRRIELPAEGFVRIALATKGDLRLTDGADSCVLARGEAVFVPATDGPVLVEGDGELFVSCPGLDEER
ncbi:mannose-6-phosphate isomerase, class I [Nigerium massiliense]|uniref:mannose-6-phosphate isomerase, class I n=1 Tax=Nigerium massiliense TaxID=1522317 RepID=UPI00058C07D8|nr:mannose-6-phosphate isomerase, class I [Nigerium massiliense]